MKGQRSKIRITKKVVDSITTNDLDSAIRVRDTSSTAFTGLLLVDGVRTDPAAMKTLDPKHIDRIEVLKGAAAVQQYGPEATTGVIVITTKP